MSIGQNLCKVDKAWPTSRGTSCRRRSPMSAAAARRRRRRDDARRSPRFRPTHDRWRGRSATASAAASRRRCATSSPRSRPAARSSAPDVYRALGRGEMRAGRSLESLLSAYRIGARVAWRRFAAAGVAAGLEPDTLYLLAESIFAYIDVLSAESAEGHALEQSAAASEAQLRRRRLVRMLVRDPPADPDAVAGRGGRRRLAAAADAGRGRDRRRAPRRAASRLPPGHDQRGDRRADLRARRRPRRPRAAGGARARHRSAPAPAAGLGTTVDWTQARISFARARAALALAGRRTPALIGARENAGELLLRCDPGLAPSWPPTGWRRWPSSRPARAGG